MTDSNRPRWYPNARLGDEATLDGKTYLVTKVENDGTVWWGRGGKQEICCSPQRETRGSGLGLSPPIIAGNGGYRITDANNVGYIRTQKAPWQKSQYVGLYCKEDGLTQIPMQKIPLAQHEKNIWKGPPPPIPLCERMRLQSVGYASMELFKKTVQKEAEAQGKVAVFSMQMHDEITVEFQDKKDPNGSR